MNNHNYSKNREKKGWAFYVIYTFILSTLLFFISGALLFFYYSHHSGSLPLLCLTFLLPLPLLLQVYLSEHVALDLLRCRHWKLGNKFY